MMANPLVTALLLILVTVFSAQASTQQTASEASAEEVVVGPGMMPPWIGPGIGLGSPGSGNELTLKQVQAHLERWLAEAGNPRLKVGNVVEKDDGIILVEIVTLDDSLVQKLEVDRWTGMAWPTPSSQHGFGVWLHRWPHYGMHRWHGWTPFPGIAIFFFMVMMVIVAVLIARMFRRGHSSVGGWNTDRSHPSALEILNARYAHGDIGRDEYLQKKSALPK